MAELLSALDLATDGNSTVDKQTVVQGLGCLQVIGPQVSQAG